MYRACELTQHSCADEMFEPFVFFFRWVFLAVLIVIGALVPKDRFELTPSIVMSSAVWAVLLHPGSTNSSGVVRVAAAALDLLMRRQHPLDIEAAEAAEKEAVAAEKADAEAAAEAGEEAAPLKKRKFMVPAQRQILAGGGSLAAVGARLVNYCWKCCYVLVVHIVAFFLCEVIEY